MDLILVFPEPLLPINKTYSHKKKKLNEESLQKGRCYLMSDYENYYRKRGVYAIATKCQKIASKRKETTKRATYLFLHSGVNFVALNDKKKGQKIKILSENV